MKGDSLKGSAHTPMYNPNVLPLSNTFFKYCLKQKKKILQEKFYLFKKKLSSKLKIIPELTKFITELFLLISCSPRKKKTNKPLND